MIKRCKYSTHEVKSSTGQRETMIIKHEFGLDDKAMVHDVSLTLFDLAGLLMNKVELPNRSKGGKDTLGMEGCDLGL